MGTLLLGVLPGAVAGIVTSGGWRSSTPHASVERQVATSPGTAEAIAAPWGSVRARWSTDLRECVRGTLIGEAAVRSVVVRAAPSARAAVVARFDRRNIFGSPQVFTLEREVVDGKGTRWYRALLPVRPNGTHGYIAAEDLTLSRTDYRMEVSLSAFRLRLFEGCELVRKYRVGIGTGDTPTPIGRFYINTLLQPPDPGTIYGTYAYGLSAFSNVLTYWRDGGFIGLHGTNAPDSIGRRSSHGCIRMLNDDIEELVDILPLGTPITIGL